LASLGYLLQTRTRAALLASLVMLIAWGFVAAYFRKAGTGKAIGGRLLGVGLALVLGASIAALSADEFGKGLYESIGKKIERVDLRDGIQKAGGIRISWFANTTRMISDAMPFGVGGGNWQVHYPAYQNAMLPDKLHGETYKTPQNAHNDVLQLAAEYGLVGVLGLGLIALSLLSALRGLGGRSFSVAILQSSAAIGLLGISVNMQFSFPLQRTVASCTAACLLAVALWPAARGRSITVPRKIAQLASAFFLFLALALAAYHFVGYEAWGHNRIADSLLRDGQYRAKVENLEILIERHPKRVGYQTQKKRYLELLEDLKGYTAESERRLALEHIDAAINLDPYNPAHRIRRLLVLDRLEEWEDLSAEAENLLVVYPYRRSVLMGAVKAYLELGQPERALPHALTLAAIAPMGFSGNETLGTVYSHLGRPETACIHYRRAIKNDPEHRSAEALAGYCEE
jgi:tetratricopeptide (TPR) repeat protein